MDTVSLKELPELLNIAYAANINVYLTGRPGIGKTQTIEAFAAAQREENPQFQMRYFYAPSMSPMDIQATAPDAESGNLKFFNNEALPNAYTDPDMEGVIFFGELPNADQTTTKLLQKYINNEDMNGVLRKPEKMRVIADGNRLEDRSGSMQQGLAFMQRFLHLIVEPRAQDSLDYMMDRNWYPDVVGFLKENPSLIDKYEEAFTGKGNDGDEARRGVWANMRSWERVSKIESMCEARGTDAPISLLQGCVGTGPATQYFAYKTVLKRLATKDEVIADPANVPLPDELSEQYTMTYMVALRINENEISQALVFFQRLPVEMLCTALKLLAMSPRIRNHALANNDFKKILSSKNVLEAMGGI